MLDDIGSNAESINENIHYTGSGTALAILMFQNLFLTLVTFGIYSAWGRTHTRRYLWGNIIFLGDRAEYTGTGKELFFGWMMIVVFYFGAAFGITLLDKIIPWVAFLLMPVYLYLFALVVYSGTRYKLSRTKWRRISFGIDRDKQSSREFVLLHFKGAFFTIITLGLYFPVFLNKRRRFLIERSHLGTAYFSFQGKDGDFFWLVLKNFFLTFITLGIYGPWMMLNMFRFSLENTSLNNTVSFRTSLRGSDVFVFNLLAYLATIFTLGLAIPWVIDRSLKLFVNSIEVSGSLDFHRIHNVETDGSAMADVAITEYDLELGF